MKDITAKQIHDDTYARCIVLDDGKTRLATLTVDVCMIYKEELDAAKRSANEITGIPVEEYDDVGNSHPFRWNSRLLFK